MTIHKIVTDNAGFKLISASKQINRKGLRPIFTNTTFFDFQMYKVSGSLREFYGNNYQSMPFPNFKEALKYIRNL